MICWYSVLAARGLLPPAHTLPDRDGEMVMVLAITMPLVILAGVAIYIRCLQNDFDSFTGVALVCRNINKCFLFMAYQFYFTNI